MAKIQGSFTHRPTDAKEYFYLEEVNDGIVDNLPPATPGASVLDVGCGWGQLGEAIRKKGFRVVGLETFEPAVERARQRMDEVHKADVVEFESVARILGEATFDVLVFSDVLEHLIDSGGALHFYARYLKPGGMLVISVPNVGNFVQRFKLLFGVFTYEETGVMDHTHFWFFTRKTARMMVKQAGYEVQRVDGTPMIVRSALPMIKSLMARKVQSGNTRAIIDSPSYRFYLKWVYPVEKAVARLMPGLLSFRIIVVAKKMG